MLEDTGEQLGFDLTAVEVNWSLDYSLGSNALIRRLEKIKIEKQMGSALFLPQSCLSSAVMVVFPLQDPLC